MKAKTPRATKALVDARTAALAHVILDGAAWPLDVCEFVRGEEKNAASVWFVRRGRKPLSYSQIRRYAVQAEKLAGASTRTSQKRQLRLHLAKRRKLFARAVATGELATALRVLDSEAKLLGLDNLELQRQLDDIRAKLERIENARTATG